MLPNGELVIDGIPVFIQLRVFENDVGSAHVHLGIYGLDEVHGNGSCIVYGNDVACKSEGEQAAQECK